MSGVGWVPISHVETLPAAAAALLVRVVEDEAGLERVFDVVHLAAEQEHGRGGVDEDLDALVLDHLLEPLPLLGVFDEIAEARAAARLDADTQAQDLLLGRAVLPLGDQRL